MLRNSRLGNDNLSKVGFTLKMDDSIIVNPGTQAVSNNMMATTVEAIIGAAFLDAGTNGLTVVRGIMDTLGVTQHHLLV